MLFHRWALFVFFIALVSSGRAQDRLVMLDLRKGDTLRLDPARVLEVKTDSLWLHGALARWDEHNLHVRMKRYRGQHLVDTLVPVARMEVRELLTCHLKDVIDCGYFDERKDRQDVWINKGTVAVVGVGALLFLFGNAHISSVGAVTALGGGLVVYGGGNLLAKGDTRRYKLGKRWKLL